MPQALLLLHSCFGLPWDISLHSQQGYGRRGISAGVTADSQRWCVTFPSKQQLIPGRLEVWKDLLPDTAQLFLHQPFPSFCKPITGEGQKCSDIKTEGSALEVASRMCPELQSLSLPCGFWWKGSSMLWWHVVISWTAQSPNNSLVSPILSTAPVPGHAPS